MHIEQIRKNMTNIMFTISHHEELGIFYILKFILLISS